MKTNILRKPIITERSLDLANQENTFSFDVSVEATKNQIKYQVELLYSVDVVRVRTITKQSTEKRTGKRRLIRSTKKSKKALITLKEGQTISLFNLGGSE